MLKSSLSVIYLIAIWMKTTNTSDLTVDFADCKRVSQLTKMRHFGVVFPPYC
jgi:hypothetical protein